MKDFILYVSLMAWTSGTSAGPRSTNTFYELGAKRMALYKIPESVQKNILSGLSRVEKDLAASEEFMYMVLAIVEVESAFLNTARSGAGAIGLMQLMPGAIKDATEFCKLGRTSPWGIKDNLMLGSCYMLWIQDRIGTDWDKTLIAYNGGIGHVRRYDKGLNIPCETANYVLKVKKVKKVLDNWRKL